jgi:glycosyltransferase involved in cell wall biosynthesis
MDIRNTIVALVDCWPPDQLGGDSLFAQALTRYLASRPGFDVHVICGYPSRDLEECQVENGITVWRQKRYQMLDRLVSLMRNGAERRILITFQASVADIVALYSGVDLWHIHCAQICFAEYQRVLSVAHNLESLIAGERFLMDKSTAVVFPSKHERQANMRQYGEILAGKPAHVIENSVRDDVFELASSALENKCLSDPVRFCMFGRIDDSMKGADIVLNTLSELGEKWVGRACFEFVGIRKNDDTDLKKPTPGLLYSSNKLNTAIFEEIEPRFPGLIQRVPWMQGKSALEHLAKADFLIMLSRYEPFGMVCAEAMALGVVPLTTRTGGLLDQTDGCAEFWRVDAPETVSMSELTQQLGRLIDHAIQMPDQQYETTSSLCANKAVSYCIDRVGSRYLELIQNLN